MKKLISLFVISLSLLAAGFAPNAAAKEFADLGCGTNYGPKKAESPVYPRRAQVRGIEGYIVMGFTIASDGSVRDVQVVEQNPENTFVRTAMQAVESLEFPPCVVDGQVTEQASVSIKYDFKLASN